MLRGPEEIEVGQIVHLYPQTKQASRNAHRMLAVEVVKDPLAHWPMVVVKWTEDGKDCWELVHKDNIRRKTASATTTRAEKASGDTVSGSDGRQFTRVRVLPGASKYAPTEGQETLF